jgi:hypothetical protein
MRCPRGQPDDEIGLRRHLDGEPQAAVVAGAVGGDGRLAAAHADAGVDLRQQGGIANAPSDLDPVVLAAGNDVLGGREVHPDLAVLDKRPLQRVRRPRA